MKKRWDKKLVIMMIVTLLFSITLSGCNKKKSIQDNSLGKETKVEDMVNEGNEVDILNEEEGENAEDNTQSTIEAENELDDYIEQEEKTEAADNKNIEQPENMEQQENMESEKEEKKVIVIDAGHQAKGNSEKEPIGPGATTTKPKVSSGTQGIKTKVPEYKVNLQVSLKLEKILTEAGYEVIMIRTTDDVNISNSERAAIANDSNADAFIRIHCNGSENPKVTGALTICQTKKNPYCNEELYESSYTLAKEVLEALCVETGANNQGIMETDTMSGINWCKVPVVIVEMGYMTNEKEDELLNTDSYQDLLAKGIANGVMNYLDDYR